MITARQRPGPEPSACCEAIADRGGGRVESSKRSPLQDRRGYHAEVFFLSGGFRADMGLVTADNGEKHAIAMAWPRALRPRSEFVSTTATKDTIGHD